MKSLDKRETPQLAEYEKCTGCFACAEICPKKAIDTFINDEGHYAVDVNLEKCIHCGMCEKVCNNARTQYGCNDLSLSCVYAGYTTDEKLRRNATSGGVFAALAKAIIMNGGVVAGASFDGTYAKHILIDKIEDIVKLQGSKYTPSSMKGIYKKIERELPNRKVLFSGTGCQVAAILAYFERSKYFDNLFTVDLICGGVPSIELVRKFNEHNHCKIKSFRNKDKYELSVVTEDGDLKIVPRKNLPLDGFAYEMTNRLSCYDCQFAFCHRKSDITIGDLWDKSVMPNDHKKGISTIIVHNERAKRFLLDSEVNMKIVPWRNVLKSNPRVSVGDNKIYAQRKHLRENITKLPYDTFERIYFQSPTKTDFVQIILKLYRHFSYRLVRNDRQKKVEKLLDGR